MQRSLRSSYSANRQKYRQMRWASVTLSFVLKDRLTSFTSSSNPFNSTSKFSCVTVNVFIQSPSVLFIFSYFSSRVAILYLTYFSVGRSIILPSSSARITLILFTNSSVFINPPKSFFSFAIADSTIAKSYLEAQSRTSFCRSLNSSRLIILFSVFSILSMSS